MANCLFCKILAKEIPCKPVSEDEATYAFHDINPQAPTHILIISKTHLGGVNDAKPEDESLLGRLILRAKEIAQSLGLKSYRLVFNSGPEAGQTVFHIHLHLLGGRRMTWPPG